MGKEISVADLKAHYHQIVYAVGAQSDRRLNIPGEDLPGSHPATEFVAWYNGHPDFTGRRFDLSQEKVAVIGIGNVAMDVARILCRTPEELQKTDIADYALEALEMSKVKEVYVLGRRGPAQAKFTLPEIEELGEMADADVFVLPEEAKLDELSQAQLAQEGGQTAQKVEIIQSYARRKPDRKSKRLTIRFLVSPVELFGDEQSGVRAMRLVKNKLYAAESGALRPKPTGQFEELEVGLVFRSVGYRGLPLPGVPFYDAWGVILNEKGRVLNPDTKEPRPGEYTAGWIKRGPSGVIGTNKADAVETVNLMLEDLSKGIYLNPTHPKPEAAEALIRQRQPNFFSYEDWLKLDEIERARGKAQGRPRVKFTSVKEMLAALGR
ncbi:MAG TPA: NADP oxidoreductase [Anaerolineae bacterium]|nr:NADP oxidoreductase [Anaerolineae bacterium]